VAEEIRREAPDLPIMFMSGHSAEIARAGLLDPRTPFLPKPFTPAQLALKVREVLDQVRRTVPRQ
jgi:DNA-binding response OmpR family regulator